jgi:hypothetical protein
MKGLHKLYTGDFNNMSVELQPDGSQVITLSKRGEGKVYRLHVKDLYGPNEEVLKDEVIKVETPKHVKKRVKEAMKDATTET